MELSSLELVNIDDDPLNITKLHQATPHDHFHSANSGDRI